MSTENRPVMVLFMGGTEDHAVTSFQKYYPESVHIITSDKYAEKYETLLDKWSGEYNFRRGLVGFVDDLFEPTGVRAMPFRCKWWKTSSDLLYKGNIP